MTAHTATTDILMLYLQSVQPIPGRGNSFTLYEAQEDYSIVRVLTYIPTDGQVTLYPEPKMKKVFMPERLETISQTQFEKLWQQGLQQKN